MKVKFAIIGMGHIAKKHIEAIQNTDGAILAAVCDTNPEQLKDVGENVRKYTSLEKMLEENQDIKVVNICVPSGLHYKLTKTIAEYKRHIIVEKPMSLNLHEAEEMNRITKNHGVKMAVVHPNRFKPAIQLLKEKFDQGVFGRISHANCTVRWNRNQAYYDQADWRGTKEYDGGVLMNQAIHNLDLLLWIMGPVKSVQAFTATRLRKIETEDVATAVVKFENGSLGVIEAATTIYPKNLEESLAIFGESASAKIGGRNANYIETWDIEGISDDEKKTVISNIKNDPFGKPGHQCIIEDMLKAITEGREPIINGETGMAPIRLISAIIESAETESLINL